MKKLLVTVLAILVAAAMVSCTPAEETTQTQSPSTSTTAPAAVTDAPTSEPVEESRYPIVEETVTYTMLIPSAYLTDPASEVPFFTMMEELTNIHFEFEIVSTADVDTKKAVIWASGDLPDLFTSSFAQTSDILKYGPEGGFLKLNDYMNDEEYMPNFIAAAAEQPTIYGSVTLDDGNIYGFPYFGAPNMYNVTAVFINTAYLDALGLKEPTTLDEYVSVLEAFKEGDANGNGDPDDEIPFTYAHSTSWTHNGAMSAWFGVGTGATIIDGAVSYGPVEEGQKAYVKFLNSLWEKGLIDEELFTQDYNTFNAKGQSGVYGSVMAYSPAYFSTGDYYENYVPIGPFVTGMPNSGSMRHRPDGNYTVLSRGAIASTCENPGPLVRWVDTLYDPYYGTQEASGMLGLHYYIDDNEEFVQNEVPAGYENFSDWVNKTHFNQLPGKYGYDYMKTSLNSSIDRQFQIAMVEKYSPYYMNEVMPYAYQTVAEGEELNEYYTDLDTYANQMFAAWVTGERDIDADWDDYIEQMKEFGVEDYVKAYQAYYDRVMALMS